MPESATIPRTDSGAPHWLIALGVVAVVATALRFVGLGSSPPGFHLDEAAIAAQVICFRQSGSDLFGTSWPLFTPVVDGGYLTPPFLYLAAPWTALFGDSIPALRAFTALFGALTVAGVFFLSRALVDDRRTAWIAAAAAALSPWGFLHSRIAWDPPLAPAFLMWALYLLVRGGPRARIAGAFGGALAALACYAYPPMRLQAPITLAVFFAYVHFMKPALRPALLPFAAVFAVVMTPLVRLTISGEIQGRFESLSIANEGFLRTIGEPSPLLIASVFVRNLLAHLSPRYLFLSGDANLRHSTQVVGQLGALEILALALGLWIALKGWRARKRGRAGAHSALVLAGIFAAGYFAAVLPAALTWEGNPHALRSLGSYPFAALLAGLVLGRVLEGRSRLGWAVTVTAAVAFTAYAWDFFARYPDRAAMWFDRPVVAVAEGLARSESPSVGTYALTIRGIYPGYPDLSLAYFLMRDGVGGCSAEDTD